MIHANKGGLRSRIIDWYINRKLRSAFRGVWLRGALPTHTKGLVVYANHSSFWDGFVIQQLGRLARWDAFAMMEEQNLAKYPFHTRIGAFSVRRGDARSALETLKYAKGLLARERAAVFVFPQGEIRTAGAQLGSLERGAEVLARTSGALSLPIAIRYAFFEHELPDVLIDLGTAHEAADAARYERELNAVVGRVHAATSLDGFTRVIEGRTSVQQRWDAFRGRKQHIESAPQPPRIAPPEVA